MKKIWIFGDSFSVPFKYLNLEYYKLKNENCKIFSEMLTEHYKDQYEENNYGTGGLDNYSIFHRFIEYVEHINEDDIVIFGWTEICRYRIADNNNRWYSINIHNFEYFEKIYKIQNICNRTYYELLFNRLNNNSYYYELNDFIKLINFILRKNKVIHWSWSNYENKVNLTIDYFEYETIQDETNHLINDGHFSVKSHNILFQKIIKYLETIKNVKNDTRLI